MMSGDDISPPALPTLPLYHVWGGLGPRGSTCAQACASRSSYQVPAGMAVRKKEPATCALLRGSGRARRRTLPTVWKKASAPLDYSLNMSTLPDGGVS